MGFFSRLLGKRDHRDSRQGSNYYKREGFFSRLFNMFGSFSASGRRYNDHYHDNTHYSNGNHRRRKYRSSWS